MDTWVISDNDSLAARIANSLRRQTVESLSTRLLPLESIDGDGRAIADCTGIVFLGATRLEPAYLESIRRIRTVLHPASKLVVVSTVADHATVLKAIRAGASDFLADDDRLDTELADLLSRVRVELKQNEARGKVVTVLPCHAPTDANVLAVNLATAIASRSGTCGLFDFHFRGGDLALLLKLAPRHSVLDLANQREPVDESMLRQAVAPHESGVQLLAAPAAFSDLKAIRPMACQQIVDLAQRCWPVTVINAEDIQHAEQVRALAMSDKIILTMRLDVASLQRTRMHVEYLGQNQVSSDHIQIVAMGSGIAGELPLAAIIKVLKVSDVYRIPDDPLATMMSINVGNPLVIESPNSKAAIAIRQLAESIIGYVPEQSANSRLSTTAVKAAAVLALNALPFPR